MPTDNALIIKNTTGQNKVRKQYLAKEKYFLDFIKAKS